MAVSDLSQVILGIARAEATGLRLLGTSVVVGPRHLASALHLIGADSSNLVVIQPKVGRIGDYQDTTDTSAAVVPLSVAGVDTFRDLCLLELPADAHAFIGFSIGGSDEAPPGTSVVTFGFPHANHGRYVLTHQTSTVGARVLIANGPLKSKHLILNIQTRPGQSGSPVFSASSGNLIALVIGSYAPGGGGGILLGDVDPATLHQTTHAVSAEYIAGMLP
jgi:S1-C subfamily serine protease